MTKRKIFAVAAGLMLSLGLAGSAAAFTITAGDYKFIIDNYDSGTTGYPDAPGPYPSAATVCNSTATCDAAGASKAPGAIGSEDTWGIFSVASITNISNGNVLFTRGVDGFLTGIFYELDDTLVTSSCVTAALCFTQALAEGGSVDLYLTATNYDPTLGTGGRIGVSGYNSITNVGGSLYLSADFGAGVAAGDTTHTYQTLYNSQTISGSGAGYLDITGGSAAATFNQNNVIDPNGGIHDAFLDATFHANGSAETKVADWTVISSTQVTGTIPGVPEPGTVALLGLGGLAAGWMSRRRKSV